MASASPPTTSDDQPLPPWTPNSWRCKSIKHAVEYPDVAALVRATAELARLPPVVHPVEIVRLKQHLADVARGDAFLLQGGDCAELFAYCEPSAIEAKIKLLLQMSLVLVWGAHKRVVRIGRIAGQYAKPRSSPTEIVDGREVPSFRGDILNGFDLDARDLDPQRLVRAYHHSAATLNYIRATLAAGIADLHHPLDWGLGHVRDPVLEAKWTEAVNFLTEAMRFMHTINADQSDKLGTIDFFSSHEGLVLEYEQALTRRAALFATSSPPSRLPPPSTSASPLPSDDPTPQTYFDTSAHFLWIGDRTRQLDGAHIEFFRGVANPIGIKIGPTTDPADLVALVRRLDPARETGKITLITRYGSDRVADLLPRHIAALADSDDPSAATRVIWQCDPMHGNTHTSTTGVKTRHFANIVSELRQTMDIHRRIGRTHLGGMHLELTGDAVTECLGGPADLGEGDLATNYTTHCDPRLNEKQALEMAFDIAEQFRRDRRE